jgi:hypothetical protein
MIASYTFLPWLRSGVANTITAADGADTGSPRATIRVNLRLSATPIGGGAALVQDIGQDVALYGPGDVIGIESRAVVRTEPQDWVTNFEPNYLAAIEFYDEDFPWRYTPAAPDTPDPAGSAALRLRPWIALVVLKESEFQDGKDLTGKPLPYVTVPDRGMFPAAAELWAWAHVHFNRALSVAPAQPVSTDMGAVLAQAQAAIAADPDVAYSRILCPRRLEPNTPYHAFLIPVFEAGRLAGLGHPPEGAPLATASAWAAYANQHEPDSFPVYYRWYFRTGALGDFEYLVGMLKPQTVDATVGVRDMDVRYPGSGVAGINDSALKGVLSLGGAFRVPDADLTPAQLDERNKFAHWDQQPPQHYPHPFESRLAGFINLADDYQRSDAKSANDPLITPPLYGRWHALTQRLLVDSSGNAVPNDTNWVHRLNLDPLYRVPAGFGAQVVEQNAEAYMNAAWEQVGDVLAANAKIRRLHLAAAVSARWYDSHFKPLFAAAAERAYTLVAPVVRRVTVNRSTIAFAQSRSVLGSTMTGAALRRVLRPHGRFMRSLTFTPAITRLNLLERVNSAEVAAAPPKTAPQKLPTLAQAAAAAVTAAAPPVAIASLLGIGWVPYAILGVSILIALLLAVLLRPVGVALALVVAAASVYLYLQVKRWNAITAVTPVTPVTTAIDPATQTPQAVGQLPKSPNFVLSVPGSGVVPSVGSQDSPTAARFKDALRDSFSLLRTSAAVGVTVPRAPIDISAFAMATVKAINPNVAILARGFASIALPSWAKSQPRGSYAEVMAYPKIDLPMYRPLKDLSIELFLPNINRIAPNSITLIETNRKFLEAYMVGLNHEFARKLLWREYPTDQRGSYFRQFWDPTPYFDPANLDSQALREKLYDIPPLHLWDKASQLGQHSNQQPTGDGGEDVVLVIRGELLKKYPTAVIYAHKAQWQTKPDGSIDPGQPRQLATLSAGEEESPPAEKVRTPLYEAKADPDIYFFGFSLTAAQARGGPGTNPQDDPGWFFVLKERPGEPRFGLEVTRNGKPQTFDELTWTDAMPGGAAGQLLGANMLANMALSTAQGDADQQQQHAEDQLVAAASVSAARWAYLLFRAPAMVAVHAAQMLRSGPT